MLRKWLSAGLVCVLAWTALPVQAAETPLDVFPADTAVVVRLKNLKATVDKVAKLADAVVKGTGPQVQFGAGLVGSLIKNPTLEGVNMAGDFYIAVFIDKGSEPGLAFATPVSDLDAATEALGEELTIIPVGDKFVVYTEDDDLGTTLKEQAESEEDTLAETIDEKSAAVFNSGDIAVFVNVPALLETFADELAMAEGGLEQLSGLELPEDAAPGVNAKAGLDMALGFARSALQFVKDHEGLTCAVTFGATEVTIEEYCKVADDSPSAEFLAANAGGDLKILNQLPAGQLGYFGFAGNINGLMEWGLEAAKSVITDEKALEAMESVASDFKGVKFGAMGGGFTLKSGTNGLVEGVSIVEVNDAAKMKAINKKYFNAFKEMDMNGLKATLTMKEGAEKVGTTSVDTVNIKYEIEEESPVSEKALEMIELMYGKNGLTTRQAYLKDKIVQTLGGSKATMEAALKAADSKTANPAIQATRSKLGAKSNFVGLLDLANVIVKGVGIAAEVSPVPLPVDADTLSGITVAPSYIGISIAMEESAVSVKTVIPVTQMQSLAKVGTELGKSMGRGQ